MQRALIVAALAVTLGAGCAPVQSDNTVSVALERPPPRGAASVLPYEYSSGVGTSTMWIAEIPAAGFVARIEQGAPRHVSAWQADTGASFIINGGYFNADYTPSGYLVADGVRVGSRMFDQDRSGLVVISRGEVSLRDLKTDPIRPGELFEHALQSYPFLIMDSVPAVATDSGYKARRSAIGVDASGTTYLIIAPVPDQSLYEFAQHLHATKLPLVRVLNLDGGPSSSMWVPLASGTSVRGPDAIPHVITFTAKQ